MNLDLQTRQSQGEVEEHGITRKTAANINTGKDGHVRWEDKHLPSIPAPFLMPCRCPFWLLNFPHVKIRMPCHLPFPEVTSNTTPFTAR